MTTDYYADWRDVPEKLWRWPNFSPEEIACRGDGKIQINEVALDKLQALRDQLGVPLIVHSAYRSPDYNRQVSPRLHGLSCCSALQGILHVSGRRVLRSILPQ